MGGKKNCWEMLNRLMQYNYREYPLTEVGGYFCTLKQESEDNTMSNFTRFMKENKKVEGYGKYAPTKSLTDDKGNPLEFEFRHISSRENEELRDSCTVDVQVKGKPNAFRPRFNASRYMTKLVAASTVVPDLYNKELQDSYGVMSPEDLLLALVDNPGEYNALEEWVQKFQGFDKTLEDKVAEAKN